MRDFRHQKCTVCAQTPSYHTIIRMVWEHAQSGSKMRAHGFRPGDMK